MYHCFIGTRVTACPSIIFGVHLTHFLPCFSATMAYLSPISLDSPTHVALLGLLIGELAGKFTGTGATASVDVLVSPVGGVIGPLVGVLKTYSSASSITFGVAITAVTGEYITSVFGGTNKAPPGDSSTMIFSSVASIPNAMVEFCLVVDGSVGTNASFELICKGSRPFLTDLLFRYFVFCVSKMIKVATIKVLGLVLTVITWT